MAPARALLLLIILLPGIAVAAASPTGTHLPVRGIALGLFAEDPGWSYRPLLQEIAATGAKQVELVVAWYQRDASSTTLFDHPRFTAPPSAIAAAIADARAVGLRVTLFPIVRLLAPQSADEWRGTLHPRDRAAWWRSYRQKLLSLARLGERAGVSVLSVGSELSTLDGQADRAAWVSMVAAVRRRFDGKLIYSGNWDHYRKVAIYDVVDQVGLCGYFALAERAPATLEELVQGWSARRDELLQFSARLGRPIIFTELGYRSIAGVALAPWDEGSPGTVDLEAQRRCYVAFCRVFAELPASQFAGVYFWNWYGWGGATSRGYTPRGKPAAAVIRAFFGR